MLIVGIVPDASIGEACHQPRKQTVASGSGRDVAAHAIRYENTRMALRALAERIPYVATSYDHRSLQHQTETVVPGLACSRVLEELLPRFDDGERAQSRPSEDHSPSVLGTNRRHAGSATWELRLNKCKRRMPGVLPSAWQDAVSRGGKRVVPNHKTLRRALKLWYGCGEDNVPSPYCPHCWPVKHRRLKKGLIHCSRYVSGASPMATSGTGRWRGGNVRAAAAVDLPFDWAFGAGGGDDVEIYTTPKAKRDGATCTPGLTIARILYFFDHDIRQVVPGAEECPPTSWVVVVEFVTAAPGSGDGRQNDDGTGYPTFSLRAQQGCKVFPTGAINQRGDHPPIQGRYAGERGRSLHSQRVSSLHQSLLRPFLR